MVGDLLLGRAYLGLLALPRFAEDLLRGDLDGRRRLVLDPRGARKLDLRVAPGEESEGRVRLPGGGIRHVGNGWHTIWEKVPELGFIESAEGLRSQGGEHLGPAEFHPHRTSKLKTVGGPGIIIIYINYVAFL